MQNFELRLVADFLGQIKFVLKRREKRVAVLDLAFDQRQVKVGTARQRLLVNLRAAADENVVRKFLRIQPVQRIENQNFRPLVFAELGEMELVGPLEITSAAPFVVLPENFRDGF